MPAKVVIVVSDRVRPRGISLTICVFGGTGFIGRHLCQALSELDVPAIAVSRNPDQAFLRRYAPGVSSLTLEDPALSGVLKGAEVIFYLSSSTRPASSPLDASHELAQAVESTKLINALRETNPSCHIVYTSSGGQIYGTGHSAPIPETTPPMPATAYALGKLMMENMLSFSARTSGLGVTILRLANPVGRWQVGKGHGLVSAAIGSLIKGQPLTIFGDGGNVRDYFDADELGRFLSRFSNPSFRPKGIFNIGSGHGVTERDVIAILERVTGRAIPVSFSAARPFDLRYAVLDIQRARDALDWQPQIGLESTVMKILDHVAR